MSAFIRPEHSLQVLRPDALAAVYAVDAMSNERPQRSFSPMPETRELLLERSECATGVPNEGFSTNIASTNGNRRGGALRFSDVPFPQYWSRYGWDLFKDHSVRIKPQIR